MRFEKFENNFFYYYIIFIYYYILFILIIFSNMISYSNLFGTFDIMQLYQTFLYIFYSLLSFQKYLVLNLILYIYITFNGFFILWIYFLNSTICISSIWSFFFIFRYCRIYIFFCYCFKFFWI